MTFLKAICTAGLLLSAAAPAHAIQSTGPSPDDKLQAACYPDVDKFCKDAVPDVDKVTACMKQHKDEISPKCREAYKASGRTD